MENSTDPPAIYWTRPLTCICLCSALDNSLGPLAREFPRMSRPIFSEQKMYIIADRKAFNSTGEII